MTRDDPREGTMDQQERTEPPIKDHAAHPHQADLAQYPEML